MQDPFMVGPSGTHPNRPNWPQQIIIPTDDLLARFYTKLGTRPEQKDIEEILTQIICVLLNEDHDVEKELLALPDFNRIVSAGNLPGLKMAVAELALSVRNRLIEFGVYKDETFPYFFDQLLDRDILLCHLPY